ncbi:MAG: hypothetical protein CL402_08585 [Acidiferrobacteraceae bacterium]|nr:hypothetical protein [Acidiferrobacteraceae bacterium]
MRILGRVFEATPTILRTDQTLSALTQQKSLNKRVIKIKYNNEGFINLKKQLARPLPMIGKGAPLSNLPC